MALERTLSIVKPDGVARNLIGEVYRRFEHAGLKIVAARMLELSQREAEGFYAVHRERPFFRDLVRYMCSGPVIVPVEVKPPKETDIKVKVGANTLYISKVQARYIDRVTPDMLDESRYQSCSVF